MPAFVEMDERSPFAKQMSHPVGPVVLINVLVVEADQAQALVKAWAADAAWMKHQPGFISTQLHRGVAGSGVFLNYAIWPYGSQPITSNGRLLIRSFSRIWDTIQPAR
jgi:hypothetical protein